MATRVALVTKRRPLICATSKKVKPLEAAEAVLQLDRRVDEVDGAVPPEARVLLLERLLGVAAELAVEDVDHELRGGTAGESEESRDQRRVDGVEGRARLPDN